MIQSELHPLPQSFICSCGMPITMESTSSHRKWHRAWKRRMKAAERISVPTLEDIAAGWIRQQGYCSRLTRNCAVEGWHSDCEVYIPPPKIGPSGAAANSGASRR